MLPETPRGAPKPPPPGAQRMQEALFGGLNEREEEIRGRDRRAADRVRPRSAAEERFRADDARPRSPPPRRRSRGWRCRSTCVRTRRLAASRRGHLIDIRRTLRASMKAGGALIDLKYLGPREKEPPIVALLDISGSMSQYTRLFLHFLHAITDAREARHDLPVRHAADQRHPRHPRARSGRGARRLFGDMSSTGRAARASPRRCASSTSAGRAACSTQGAVVLLITDGLERDGDDTLSFEMDRLHRSCRRLIWLNPLLRFEGFEARAKGVRTMLPHVDELRPIHNLESMTEPGARAVGRAGEGLRSETMAAAGGLTEDQHAFARRRHSQSRRGLAQSRTRRGAGDRGGDLGLGAAAGRLQSGDRQRGQFPRLRVGRLRRGRGGDRSHRRDRQRQAENAGIRRRRRDRLERRPVLRRHHPRLCGEGR